MGCSLALPAQAQPWENIFLTRSEVAEHNKDDDCWVIIDGVVYNITNYMKGHPGGYRVLRDYGGKDASEDFIRYYHRKTELEDRKIVVLGKITETQKVEKKEEEIMTKPTELVKASFPNGASKLPGCDTYIFRSPTSAPQACAFTPTEIFGDTRKAKKGLDPVKWQRYRIDAIQDITHNTKKFRFGLQTKSTVLGLPIGKHLCMRIKGSDGQWIREEKGKPYTPVSSDKDLGYFDLVIKVYHENLGNKNGPLKGEKGYRPAGLLTPSLFKMKVGDYVEARGPTGYIEYTGPGQFTQTSPIRGKAPVTKKCTNIVMCAGGTGIAPMLQIMRHIQDNPADRTNVTLFFGNVSVDDILCQQECDALRADSRFKVVLTIDRGPGAGWTDNNGRPWQGSIGFITTDLIQDHAMVKPTIDDTLVVICGPPGMTQFLKIALFKTEFTNKQRVLTM